MLACHKIFGVKWATNNIHLGSPFVGKKACKTTAEAYAAVKPWCDHFNVIHPSAGQKELLQLRRSGYFVPQKCLTYHLHYHLFRSALRLYWQDTVNIKNCITILHIRDIKSFPACFQNQLHHGILFCRPRSWCTCVHLSCAISHFHAVSVIHIWSQSLCCSLQESALMFLTMTLEGGCAPRGWPCPAGRGGWRLTGRCLSHWGAARGGSWGGPSPECEGRPPPGTPIWECTWCRLRWFSTTTTTRQRQQTRTIFTHS